MKVTNHKGPWQSVTVLVHRLGEIDTPAFRDFLTEAAASFHKNLLRLQTKPEDVMPWKLKGERWHLGEKGFPIGKKLRWDRAALPALLAVVRAVEPEVEVRWDNRDAITLRVSGGEPGLGAMADEAGRCAGLSFPGQTRAVQSQPGRGIGDAGGVEPSSERWGSAEVDVCAVRSDEDGGAQEGADGASNGVSGDGGGVKSSAGNVGHVVTINSLDMV